MPAVTRLSFACTDSLLPVQSQSQSRALQQSEPAAKYPREMPQAPERYPREMPQAPERYPRPVNPRDLRRPEPAASDKAARESLDGPKRPADPLHSTRPVSQPNDLPQAVDPSQSEEDLFVRGMEMQYREPASARRGWPLSFDKAPEELDPAMLTLSAQTQSMFDAVAASRLADCEALLLAIFVKHQEHRQVPMSHLIPVEFAYVNL